MPLCSPAGPATWLEVALSLALAFAPALAPLRTSSVEALAEDNPAAEAPSETSPGDDAAPDADDANDAGESDEDEEEYEDEETAIA